MKFLPTMNSNHALTTASYHFLCDVEDPAGALAEVEYGRRVPTKTAFLLFCSLDAPIETGKYSQAPLLPSQLPILTQESPPFSKPSPPNICTHP